MDWVAHADAALVGAAVAGAASWFVPLLVARIPEPEPDPDDELDAMPEPDALLDAAPEVDAKPLYADLAAVPGLAPRCALAGAVIGALVGIALGWTWALLFWLPLVPVGVALAYVDHRTRLLPTKVIAPTYVVLVPVVLVAAALAQDLDALKGAGLGWLVAGGLFWLLWRFTPGMGYGDVRLSGILGIALGYLGWAELLVGIYAGFLLGAVGWIPLRLLRITRDRNFPFGPFMLVGAVVGVVWGPAIAGSLALGQG